METGPGSTDKKWEPVPTPRKARSSSRALEGISLALSGSSGSFGLTYDPHKLPEVRWEAGIKWGGEEPDGVEGHVMAFAEGSSASEAIDRLLDKVAEGGKS